MFEGGFVRDQEDELKIIFDLMDRDGKGYIDAQDMQEIFKENLLELDQKYFESLERVLDENQNENLDFEDFKSVLQKSALRNTPFE